MTTSVVLTQDRIIGGAVSAAGATVSVSDELASYLVQQGLATFADRAPVDEWAIITVHRAVLTSPGTLEMTVANFSTWLDYLNERVRRGGIVVAPFGEVYDEFYG